MLVAQIWIPCSAIPLSRAKELFQANAMHYNLARNTYKLSATAHSRHARMYTQYPESPYCIRHIRKRHALEKGVQVLWGFHYLTEFRLWILTWGNSIVTRDLHIFLTNTLRQTCLRYLRHKSNIAWKRGQCSTARKNDVKTLNVAKMMTQIKREMAKCN